MTYTDQYRSGTTSDFGEEENYLTAFGITLTPEVGGITFGILGLLAALYIILNFGTAAFDNYQKVKQLQQQKQEEVDFQKSRGAPQKIAKIERDLKEAKMAKANVLSSFSSQQTMSTLLFDISNLASVQKITITSFKLQSDAKKTKAVEETSLSDELSSKVKQQSIDMAIQGSFENTQKFLRDLERLQPLLLISNINVSLTPEELVGTVSVDQKNKTVKVTSPPQNKLDTSFTLRAILPLSAKEKEVETPDEQKQS